SPATVNRELTTLKKILNMAVDDELIQHNLSRRVVLDELVIYGHVQDLLERGQLAIHRGRRDESFFASLFQLPCAASLEVLNHASRNLIEELSPEDLHERFEAVLMNCDRLGSQGSFDPFAECFYVFLKQRWLLVG